MQTAQWAVGSDKIRRAVSGRCNAAKRCAEGAATQAGQAEMTLERSEGAS